MNEKERINELDKIGLRFDQFIIGVNGALIAYSMKQIEDEIISWTLLPLCFAVLFWAMSFYYGVNSTRRLISTRIVEIAKDRDEIKFNPQYYKIFKKKFHEIGDLANKNNKKMYQCLYAGGVMFITWQIIKLVIRSNIHF